MVKIWQVKINFVLFNIAMCFFLTDCNSKPPIKLTNQGFLRLADSINIPIDSLTIPNSNNSSFVDSFLIVPNDGLNSMSIINLKTFTTKRFDFSLLPNEVKMDAGWISSSDSIFIYDKKKSKIFLIDSSMQLIDSFPTRPKEPGQKDLDVPSVGISSSQIPFVHGGTIYLSGVSLGENRPDEKKRFAIRAVSKEGVWGLANFPEDYRGKNLGGLYYRIIQFAASDSLLYLSFPASAYVGIVNLNTGEATYRKLYPDVTKDIEPFGNNSTASQLSADQNLIAEHYFSQYSFKEIIVDPYRKMIYRILSFPAKENDIENKRFGIQDTYILCYDQKLNYLGCTALPPRTSTKHMFVDSKGLFIYQKRKDENNLFYYLFTFNDSFYKLPK
ncbi:MAG: DUF4221 domain-containing protein [Chitinophagaceae bacterium]|nr:MAG: DUF4221 domain-containing protein [Chitinophagaceae bacterium]